MSINVCNTLPSIITQPLAHYKRSEKVYKFQFIVLLKTEFVAPSGRQRPQAAIPSPGGKVAERSVVGRGIREITLDTVQR